MSKVSVIVPVYNAEKYLSKCISSIAEQTLKDVEIIAVNDGSVDNSLNVLDDLSIKYKDKLKVIDKENGGTGSARNIGLLKANGEYIKFVDADDYLKLDVLEKMYDVAKESHCSLVRGNMTTCIGPIKFEDKCNFGSNVSKGIIDVKSNKDYIVTETPGTGNKLIKRDLLDDLSFSETKWEDLSIMPIAIAKSEKVFNVDEDVNNYRIHANTTLKDFFKKIPNVYDIIKSLDHLEDQMNKAGFSDEYKEQMEGLYSLHTLFRVENAMNWVNLSHDKKTVVISSLCSILDFKYPDWKKNRFVGEYRKVNPLFNFDMKRIDHFRDDDYEIVSKDTAKSNLQMVLK